MPRPPMACFGLFRRIAAVEVYWVRSNELHILCIVGDASAQRTIGVLSEARPDVEFGFVSCRNGN